MINEIQRDYVRTMMAMHHLYLLAADRFLTAAMRDLERQGQGFRHEKKHRMNQMLRNTKALNTQYDELFTFLYGLKEDPRQADMMRRDATFLARLGCKAMDRIADDPSRIEMVEKAVERLKTSGLIDIDRINKEFTFR